MEEAIEGAIVQMPLKNSEDQLMKYRSHRPMEPERRRIAATAFSDLGGSAEVYAIVAEGADGEIKEFIVAIDSPDAAPAPRLITGSCQITYEDLSPSECVEYAFDEAPGQWAMAPLSLDALETYRGMKFEAWKSMLLKPTCEAQFRRMLQLGMVAKLYDPHVFPTPEALKSRYQVTDERTGKLIELPHPVKELRVWDPVKGQYKEIDTQLAGAPEEAAKDAWWSKFVEELNKTHGQEYIDGLMASK